MININIQDDDNKNTKLLQQVDLGYIEYANAYLKTLMINNFEKMLINIFHIYILVLFEILFYFYYIVMIEKKEILDIILSFASQIHNFIDISNKEKQEIIARSQHICDSINKNYYDKTNNELFEVAMNVILVSTAIVFVLFMIHIYLFKNIKRLLKIIGSSVFFLVIVVCFEYLFFKNIVLKYRIIDNNIAICYFTKGLN
jgi:hypothetical protein